MPQRKRIAAEQAAPGIVSAVMKLVPGEAERARILVVDDDDHNLLAIRTVIEDVADVVTARSGEEALRHLLKGEFAVILLDVYMPGMDGYETARMIRGREQTKRIPIIFLSAVNKEMEHLIRGYSMGAVDYVFKPVEPIVLRSKVAVFVDLFQMTRELQHKAEHEKRLHEQAIRANTERLRVEHELRLSEQRQAAILGSLPLILYSEPAAAEPRIPEFVSGNFAQVTGFTFDQVREDPTLWRDRLHPDDRARVLAALGMRERTGALSIEYRWQCADGEYRHFLDQAVLVRDARGEPLEFAGTLLDVTDRKELETQLLHAHKMDAIGNLTGGIAHDFNNLLAAVIGGLGLIERRIQLDEQQRKLLGMTQRAAEQGAELVARLLAFARKQKLQPAAVEVTALADSVDDLLSHTLGGLVAIDWDLEPGVGRPWADSTQLELALVNLAINARDAMPDGGTIRIAARSATLTEPDRDLPPGDYVVLSVADTGCGIPNDLIERVTEPFFTTKEAGKGTGLGLSMVYGFASQSGGTMRIESAEGEGTLVSLWLPLAVQAPEPRRAPESLMLSTPHASVNILLVDDHDSVRATTAALLDDLGHSTVAAADGTAVLDALRSNPAAIDLLISDYAMPHLSGSEVIRRARDIRPGLPAILITGYADAAALDFAGEHVIAVAKPFTPLQLEEAIRKALEPAT